MTSELDLDVAPASLATVLSSVVAVSVGDVHHVAQRGHGLGQTLQVPLQSETERNFEGDKLSSLHHTANIRVGLPTVGNLMFIKFSHRGRMGQSCLDWRNKELGVYKMNGQSYHLHNIWNKNQI